MFQDGHDSDEACLIVEAMTCPRTERKSKSIVTHRIVSATTLCAKFVVRRWYKMMQIS